MVIAPKKWDIFLNFMFGDDEPVLVLEDRSNVISTTNKIIKTNDACDYPSEDIENIIDDSTELGQISIDL